MTFPFSNASPAVTVVMPAYNHARYVVHAINSVRGQTFSNWELIVIDDGSTDDTWTVLNEYAAAVADPRIRILTQSNAGSHATLNRGMNMANSPYLAILNSDDMYSPDRLQHLMQVAKAAGGEIFIATGVRLIDADSLPISDDHWWQAMYRDLLKQWQFFQTQSGNPAVQALLWGNFTVSTSNFFLSRGVWQRVGSFRHLRYVPDWDYALRVACELPESFIYLPNDALLDYRLHGQNTILGGALHNHAEAVRVLRTFQKKWVASGHLISPSAIDRLHYLNRFIRHEHARQLLEKQKTGWVEQVEALTAELQRSRGVAGQWQAQAEQRQAQAEQWQAQAEQWQAQAEQWQAQAGQWQAQVHQLHGTLSWRLTAPLRTGKSLVKRTLKAAKRLATKLLTQLRRPPIQRSSYDEWLKNEASMLGALRSRAGDLIRALDTKPLISIVMPVHNTPIVFLRAAVQSVQEQWYDRWELCICNDASEHPETLELLYKLEKSDPRIKVVHRVESGHIVQATNDAIAMASGDYIAFLDHDDQLAPHALFRLVQTLNAQPDVDLIYSDEDKINEKGKRCLPFFKPEWSPILQWSQNFVGHLMCVRSSLLLELGGLQPGTQGSQDHDLVLRLAAKGAKITHLPEVLYHWRMHAASTSSSPQAKPYAHIAGKEAVARHLTQRYGDQFDRVDDSEYPFVYLPRFRVPAGALASIIIPTLDKADLLKACIDSIRKRTQGAHYEIIVLDNGSQEPATHEYFEALRSAERIRVVNADIPFNWSLINNIGRRHAKGQVLVFLNNDTEVISPDWLQRLMEYALLPDVATVGPLLLYPDGTIQHAGVVVGMGGWADHVFKGEAVAHFPSPFVSSVLPRNVLANTGACMAIATDRFDKLGGFDEAFQICGSDVELGIRAHNQGYFNVYLPSVQLYHLESKTRSPSVPAVDFEQSALKYAPFRLEGDPFFNPNLDLFCPKPTPRFPAVQIPNDG